MRKIFPAAVILAFLTGCSTVSGWFDRDGSSTGIPERGVTGAPGYNAHTARPYPNPGSVDPHTGGVVLNYDEKHWPPVIQGQAFPPQHMWAD